MIFCNRWEDSQSSRLGIFAEGEPELLAPDARIPLRPWSVVSTTVEKGFVEYDLVRFVLPGV